MAGRGGPSFLKRQKEQARSARQLAKRATQQARRDERASGVRPVEDLGEPIVPEMMMQDDAVPRGEPGDEPGEDGPATP
jgi:hypothetical protein